MSKLFDYDGDNLEGLNDYRKAVQVAPIEQIRARLHQLCYHTPLITREQSEEANILENEVIARNQDTLTCGA